MEYNEQNEAPIYEALEYFRRRRVVPFDVPGHKRGRGNPELRDLLGEKCVSLDVNSMKPLDNLGNPISVIRKAEQRQAAAPALPLKDTVKERSGDMLVRTPPRETLAAVQTPQAFQADIIKAALTSAVTHGASYTDDCAAVEALGVRAYLSRGSEDNIKITTPADLYLAEAILRNRSAK